MRKLSSLAILSRVAALCLILLVAGSTVRADDAVAAAGKIHTDLAKGFIRAEVFTYEDLRELGSEREIKAKGKQRLEGKDYVVQDGDIMSIRHSG